MLPKGHEAWNPVLSPNGKMVAYGERDKTILAGPGDVDLYPVSVPEPGGNFSVQVTPTMLQAETYDGRTYCWSLLRVPDLERSSTHA